MRRLIDGAKWVGAIALLCLLFAIPLAAWEFSNVLDEEQAEDRAAQAVRVCRPHHGVESVDEHLIVCRDGHSLTPE